jgi:hypothetical protein
LPSFFKNNYLIPAYAVVVKNISFFRIISANPTENAVGISVPHNVVRVYIASTVTTGNEITQKQDDHTFSGFCLCSPVDLLAIVPIDGKKRDATPVRATPFINFRRELFSIIQTINLLNSKQQNRSISYINSYFIIDIRNNPAPWFLISGANLSVKIPKSL